MIDKTLIAMLRNPEPHILWSYWMDKAADRIESLSEEADMWKQRALHQNEVANSLEIRAETTDVEPKVIWVVEEEDRIDWIADNEAEAWRYAGKDPENRRVVKYMECKE